MKGNKACKKYGWESNLNNNQLVAYGDVTGGKLNPKHFEKENYKPKIILHK